MTKLSFGAHPFLLGFEQLERLVERTAKSGAEGYPPYNIEAVTENAYRITIAVAGFAEDELTIEAREAVLTVKGEAAPFKHQDRNTLHKVAEPTPNDAMARKVAGSKPNPQP